MTPITTTLRALLDDVTRTLAACHDRIHCLPRTSDTALAKRIERVRAEIASSESLLSAAEAAQSAFAERNGVAI